MSTALCTICNDPLPPLTRRGGKPRAACSPACAAERNRRLTRARPRHTRYDNPQPTVKTKRCPDCRERKGAAEFYPDRATATGLSAYCRRCARERDQRPERRVRHNQTRQAWYRRHRQEERAKRRERAFAAYWQAKLASNRALREAGEALRP